MKKYAILILGLLILSGCATRAGPFVTNISSDGEGDLVIEKCMAKLDPWMGTVNNDNCTSSSIRL